MKSVKIKVLLGYFTLIILASLTIWVIYSEILHYSKEKVDFNPANNKFIYVNNILTNLYQAEGLERSYAETGQSIHYQDYLKLMDTISIQIDELALMVNNPIQQMHTDSIKKLLKVKQKNLKELSAIKKKNSSKVRYQQALKKIPSVKDSIERYSTVYKNVTTNRDSVYVKKEKKKFFERLADVFASKNKADSSLHVWTTQSVKIDSLVDKDNSADSIAGFITAIVTEIRDENVSLETRLKQKEQEVLANDRTITLQLRQMLSDIEKDELFNSFMKVNEQQNRIEKATIQIILVGIFALGTIIFFLVNILKDISKSQHYRINLEKTKAYSESLLKSKEQLMLSLTHDLKSPLNSIIGFTGFIENDDDVVSPRHQKYLQNIRTSSSHILKLINDLLDLARLETGKLSIDSIPFNLKLLIDDIVEGFRPQAQAKDVDLELQFNISPSLVYTGDPVRITQILSNLISNALKFTEEGRVAIQVSSVRVSKKTDQIQMDVTDSGIGISEENIQRIFEEFARVTTTEKQYEGTGLGLTITQKLIHLLGGSIKLESKPGEGSHFTIVFPLEKEEQLAGDSTKIKIGKSQEIKADLAGKIIWLIDDDQTLLEMTSIILKSAGMVVHSFSDPRKAVSSFTKGCADLLITDIQMPIISGVEVFKQIRRKNGGQITAIAISGSSNGQHECGEFSAFIQKPFYAQTLIDAISGQQQQKIVPVPVESQIASEINQKNGYNLSQFAAFAAGDPESFTQILVSFITTGKQNASLFRKYIQEKNENGISELSHKMLTLFRQLEAHEIVELLSQLERKGFTRIDNNHYFSLGKSALEKIEVLLQTIQKEENIHSN
ncbi:MAG TPA: ATP-binding protein [Prolixibacteraceae bacterium]|nr:ATP-binding protein [Prolixibacteraceae bacterium]